MALNRITQYGPLFEDRQHSSPPDAQSAVSSIPTGFQPYPAILIVSLSPQQIAVQQQIYRWAYEQAQAAARIPRHHRRLFSVWN